MSDWQDIKTAPKDGTIVDLWLSSPDRIEQWRETDCWWNADRKLWANLRGMWDSATHWMSLPDPPVSSSTPNTLASSEDSGSDTAPSQGGCD